MCVCALCVCALCVCVVCVCVCVRMCVYIYIYVPCVCVHLRVCIPILSGILLNHEYVEIDTCNFGGSAGLDEITE